MNRKRSNDGTYHQPRESTDPLVEIHSDEPKSSGKKAILQLSESAGLTKEKEKQTIKLKLLP